MICMCGIQSGDYPHHEDCPFPYFGNDELMKARWEMMHENRIEGRKMLKDVSEDEIKYPYPPGWGEPKGHGCNDA